MQWDHTVDVLVVGSGNGAMTAALCSHDMGAGDVLVIEKASQFGGTSALSGGGVWTPCNRYAKEAGAKDSLADAKRYLQETTPAGMVPEAMVDSYLENGPKMVDFLHTNSRVRYQSLEHYPDYYTDKPGARSGHRSMEPEPINITELGGELENMVPPTMFAFGRFAMTQVEAQVLVGRLKGWWKIVLKMLCNYLMDGTWRFRSPRSRRTTGGGAGIIRLRLSLQDRNVPLWLDTAMEDLIAENGRVLGARVRQGGKTRHIRARKAVVLAAGGFEKNQAMREQYLPAPTNTAWSAGCATNTGDAIRAGLALGAATRLMDNAWWCSTMCVPGSDWPFLSIVPKSLPGSIVVNPAGRRFSNESQNYMAFQKELFATHSDEQPNVPSYMIFDAGFRQRYSVYPLLGPDWMLPRRYFDNHFMARDHSVAALAEKVGIDPAGLTATVERFNGYAITGKDLEFGRGDVAYDRYYGDPSAKPNPCLAPILKPPFYALRLEPGDFGTQGGLVTNPNAQVLREDGSAIEGLYAIGNCSAAVLPLYPGPGSTLGPAMTFGYQAAKHITGYCD